MATLPSSAIMAMAYMPALARQPWQKNNPVAEAPIFTVITSARCYNKGAKLCQCQLLCSAATQALPCHGQRGPCPKTHACSAHRGGRARRAPKRAKECCIKSWILRNGDTMHCSRHVQSARSLSQVIHALTQGTPGHSSLLLDNTVTTLFTCKIDALVSRKSMLPLKTDSLLLMR